MEWCGSVELLSLVAAERFLVLLAAACGGGVSGASGAAAAMVDFSCLQPAPLVLVVLVPSWLVCLACKFVLMVVVFVVVFQLCCFGWFVLPATSSPSLLTSPLSPSLSLLVWLFVPMS